VKSIAEAIDSEAEKKISAQLSFLIQEVKDKKAPAEIRKLAGAIQSDLQNIFKVEIFITPNEPVSLAEGKKIYDANCKVCHGLSGNGDGPLALQLNPKPAVLSNPKITSDDVTKPYDNFQIISVGVGGTSMLGWAETMSEMDIWNVTYYIRSFSNKNMKLPETPVSSAADTTGSAEKKLDVIFADIRNLLDLSLSSAKAKNGKKGADLAMDSYLIYENLEAGLKAKHKNLALRLESSFGEFQSKVRSDAPLAQVEAVYNSIQKDLVEAEELLKKKIGFTGLFTQSISIIIREGFEAILVFAALIAFLIKSKNQDKLNSIYSGAILGVVASFLTAYLFHEILNVSVSSQELMEGWIMLAAVAVLFWVSYWLVSKIGAQRWQNYISGKMRQAVSTGNALTLSLVAFLSVYREGFETVLFYKALYSYAGDSASGIVPGFIAGVLCLAVIYYLITKMGMRVPVKWFFTVTSVFLYYMAFTFMGKGLHQLQTGSVLTSTAANWLPQIAWLGIYPTWETFVGQGILVVAYIFAIIYSFGIRPELENRTLKAETRHIQKDIAIVHELLSHISQHVKRCKMFVKDTNDRDLKEISEHLKDIDLKVHELSDHARDVEARLLDEYDRLAKPLGERTS
ncbi:MAG: iron permease, partial [Nitrospinae bacterium RIFCSPLOWO2_12_FULL_47_7]